MSYCLKPSPSAGRAGMKASRLNGRAGRAIIKSFFGSIASLLNQKMVKLGAKFVGACLPDRQERITQDQFSKRCSKNQL